MHRESDGVAATWPSVGFGVGFSGPTVLTPSGLWRRVRSSVGGALDGALQALRVRQSVTLNSFLARDTCLSCRYELLDQGNRQRVFLSFHFLHVRLKTTSWANVPVHLGIEIDVEIASSPSWVTRPSFQY